MDFEKEHQSIKCYLIESEKIHLKNEFGTVLAEMSYKEGTDNLAAIIIKKLV